MSGASDWHVVVPSFQRAATLSAKTLPLLLERGIPADRITVYCVPEERAAYKASLAGTGVELRPTAPAGVGPVRNFITRDWPVGSRLVSVDDDVSDLRRRLSKTEDEPLSDLPSVIRDGFTWAESAGLTLWGIYPVPNPFFMRPNVTTDLKYIVGCFYGVIVRHDDAELVDLQDKEDFERSIKHYLRDGGVLRMNYVAPRTRYYREPGGMQVTRTPERVTASAYDLLRRFPELCELNESKASAWTEVRLKDRRGKVGHGATRA